MDSGGKRKDNSSHSRAHSRDYSRKHSRDYGDKRISHRDDSSHSRKTHTDHYSSRDHHDSRGRYGSRSNRHHKHHRHGYSSNSSMERHKRRRPSSSPERHHSDRHRSHKRDKKRKLSKSDRGRQSSSAGTKKKKHHRRSSNSHSPVRYRHGDDRKSGVTICDDKADSLKQAPDEVLEEELVNLESQISMDKKMLLKNLLRKERLELLHESLEKEQSNDDLLVVNTDDKLKEELQQLDEAIATGKNALMKVMKRIGSTESGRNSSEQ